MAEERPAGDDRGQQAIVREFTYLLEKSKQLFNGVRDLPQFGQKHWQGYFARTFDVFTRLWKFQQQNRQVLDARFSLKRWQIGEIASKIGQLYYQYYMRTCEAGYLHEAYSFYEAIRNRAYYANVLKEERADLMVKKLRYYARFIVVCLLLPKPDIIVALIKEMSKYVDDYVKKFDPIDKDDWELVLREVSGFLEANRLVSVLDTNAMPVSLSHRLKTLEEAETATAHDGTKKHKLMRLREAFIIGNTSEQVKFSELTLDMFRMLEALEREPKPSYLDYEMKDVQENPDDEEGNVTSTLNPHKFLLYKPTLPQLINYISSGIKDLPNQSVVLIYLSADCVEAQTQKSGYDSGAYCCGGVATKGFKREEFEKKPPSLKETNCLYPGDLLPFTRRPMMLIVENSNSQAFSAMPVLFGQPSICLLAPKQLPPTFQDTSRTGGLLTLFLHSPLVAFCYVCSITDVQMGLWQRCQEQVTKALLQIRTLIHSSKEIDYSYIKFMDDPFLSEFIVRFVFTLWVLSRHAGFKGPDFQPQCTPRLPGDEITGHAALQGLMLELATMLDIRSLFQ